MTYIQRRAFDELPPDAIVLTESEVVSRYENVLIKWKPASEVWPLKFGTLVVGSCNMLITFNIASYYRRRCKLPSSGSFLYYTVTAGMCGLFSTIFHHTIIQRNIMLQKECNYCNYAKSVAVQLGTFTVYGVFSSCFSSAYNAVITCSYPIMGFQSWADTKETVMQYVTFSKKIKYRLAICTVVTALVTCAMTVAEHRNFDFVNQKLYEKDQKLRAAYAEMQASK